MPRNFSERTDLTRIIKSILDSYPLGNGILRELLQNSDDASATTQTFILDLRTHPSASVVDADLSGSQGPALLAVNDTLFSEADWKGISTLHGSSKTTDETKIGKFGIGARACYHLTDNPHFLSGDKLVIFDPHQRFSESDGRRGGVMIDIPKERHLYLDQFVAFGASFTPDADGVFRGTIVRLPLRTPAQALTSTIKPEVVDADMINTLFHEFVERELSVVMLFLKHIRSICLKVIEPNGRERFVGSADIPDLSIAKTRMFSRNTGAREESFTCNIDFTTLVGGKTFKVSQTWRVLHSVRSTEETARIISDKLGYPVGSKLSDDKLFSHVALAFPIGGPASKGFNGRLFTLLPLPIYTGFPVHMHGILALTQDRQSLRNIEEKGTGKEARERLLVTWNQSIFDKFLPAAWSSLLRVLVEKNKIDDIWTVWPRSEHATTNGSAYWTRILPNLLRKVIESNLAIFPAISNADPPTGSRLHVALSNAIIAAQDDDPILLWALAGVGLTIVQLPGYIQKSLPAESKHLVLHPDSPRLRDSLLGGIPKLGIADDACKLRILEYLVVSPGKISNAIELPLVPLVNGSWLSLKSTNSSEIGTPVLVTREEETVFKGCDEYLVPLFSMPAAVAQVFCSPEATRMVNIARLDKTIVWRYLNNIFGGLNPAEDETTGEDTAAKVEWLIRFWKWVATWADKDGLLGLVKQFHLLPTAQGTLRKMESCVVLPIPEGLSGNRTMMAWATLGVRFLDPNLAPYSSAFRDFSASHTDVLFLIRSISPQLVSGLDKPSALLIQTHLIQSLRSSTGKPVRMDERDRQTFLSLPIFPTRVPSSRSSGTKRSERIIGPASGSLIYTRVDDSCPVPIVPSTTFFDVTPASGALATLFDAVGMKKALDELGILEMSITHLATQSLPCLDMLLDRIIHRLSDLSQKAKNDLQHMPFVSVVASSKRMPPTQVVDPHSQLAPLYEGEPGKLPSGQWAGESYLIPLSAHGFLLRNLTAEIAEERISYLSRSWGEDDHSRIFDKAKLFLKLLDKTWSPSFDASRSVNLAKNWLPIRPNMPLATPAQSRDSDKTAFLFDLVLQPADGRVENEALRALLGWDRVATAILQVQFSRALTHPKKRGLRLHALITEFSSRLLSEGEIESLKAAVENCAWIPVGEKELIRTEYALLERSNLQRYGRLRIAPRSLLDAHKGQGAVFLQRMGCTASPSLETLLNEIKTIVLEPGNRSASEVLDILREMVPMLPGCSAEDLGRIYVPGIDNVLHPKDEIYYLDNTATDFRPESGFCAHPDLSPSLARALGLQFLSSLELGDDDDDDDDLQMGEDLTNRVQNILKEHDVRYALNEFLANAVDAKAREFSVVLDERTFESSKVLGPGLAHLQQRPSLFLYNDAKLSDDDFRGLRKVGQGGKRSNPDSIGRYGLGALSLFHFTDVVQVVSGDRILILDPSGTHLPPRKGKTRTSLIRRLSEVSRNFPDQLLAFDSIHGFSKSVSSYSGTLFRLSLRDNNKPSVLSSKCLQVSDCLNLLRGPYFDLAKDATFFTGLENISVTYLYSMGQRASIWSIEASRTTPQDNVEVMSLKATHHDGTTNSQRWLITKSTTPISSVPSEHAKVLEYMGLHQSQIGLVAQTALMLKDSTPWKESAPGLQPLASTAPSPRYLFSTMRLPVQTSLSAHISAQFAISSDRRHIRFEAADASGHRLPEAAFNKWILDQIIPPLYISSIHFAATSSRTVKNPFSWWPVLNHGTNDASISREIVETFYTVATKTAIPICYTVTSELIAPIRAIFPANETPFGVKEILRKLKTENFVQPLWDVQQLLIKAAAADSQVQFLSPSCVREILLSQSPKLIALYHDKYTSVELGVSLFGTMLSYLLGGSVSAANLPLIVLADTSLTFANVNQPTRYICSGQPPDLFSLEHFLHPKFDERTQKLLVQNSGLNIKYFNSAGALALIHNRVPPQPRCVHSAELQQWITTFWETYNDLPGPPSVSSLASLPLIPIVGGEHVSLEYCHIHDEVMTEPIEHPTLVSAMQKMDLVFCQVPAPLRNELRKPFNIQAYLKVIRFKVSPFASLSPEESQAVRDWVQEGIYECRDAKCRKVLKGLPLWEARRNGCNVVVSAQELEMLPFGLNIDTFIPYLGFNIALANHSYQLETVLSCPPKMARVTSERLAELLTFPQTLQPADVDNYAHLLDAFLSLGGSGKIPVPDGNLTLRNADQLYDHSVELFSLALQSCQEVMFLHPRFRHLQSDLHSTGLHSEVDWNAFLLCARTVDQDSTIRRLPEDEIMPRAEAVFDFYNSSLPFIVMGNAARWIELNGLNFVPRSLHRSPSSTYDVQSYCSSLPRIVTPGQILRSKFEAVAWSQRALFRDVPSANLLALNSALGVPTVAEVVEHLKVLALQVAPEHPRNRSLLHQLRSTYDWLQTNKEAARLYLLAYETSHALFLNVDEPETDTWEWHPAGTLLFNTQWDYPNRFKARAFLQPYRSLLLAAGAKEISDVGFEAGERADGLDKLRKAFDDMRHQGQFTNVVLMPVGENEGIDTTALRAHSAFLAAAIPHVREARDGCWLESTSAQHPFPGTYFGARAVLDFIYTGRIKQQPDETDDGHMTFLRDLRELLENADEWDMADLKDEIGRLVDHWKLLSPDTYRSILADAQKYGAASLEKYCRDWAVENPDLLTIEPEEDWI